MEEELGVLAHVRPGTIAVKWLSPTVAARTTTVMGTVFVLKGRITPTSSAVAKLLGLMCRGVPPQ